MIKIKKSVLKLIQKALNEQPKTLNYFKKEFINILKKQYDELDKKESKEKSFEKSIMLYAGDVFIEKGRAANIGEVREWKGRKFKKIAQGKWRPIYESASRGAKQSIKLLAKKISKVNSTDELMEIIMQNVNRFQDENGKILPIVEELKNAVNEKKQSLNAGKPTTKKVAPKTEDNNEYTENYKPKSIEDWDSADNGDNRSKDSDKVHNILDKNKKAIQEKLSKINLTKVDGEFINTKATNIRIKESSKLWKEYIGENEPDSLKEIKKLWEEESKKYFNEKYKEKAEKEIVAIPDEKLLSLKEEYEDLPTIDDCINGHNINEYCKGGYTRTLGMNNSTKRAVLKKHYLLPMIENEIKKRKLDSKDVSKTKEKPENHNIKFNENDSLETINEKIQMLRTIYRDYYGNEGIGYFDKFAKDETSKKLHNRLYELEAEQKEKEAQEHLIPNGKNKWEKKSDYYTKGDYTVNKDSIGSYEIRKNGKKLGTLSTLTKAKEQIDKRIESEAPKTEEKSNNSKEYVLQVLNDYISDKTLNGGGWAINVAQSNIKKQREKGLKKILETELETDEQFAERIANLIKEKQNKGDIGEGKYYKDEEDLIRNASYYHQINKTEHQLAAKKLEKLENAKNDENDEPLNAKDIQEAESIIQRDVDTILNPEYSFSASNARQNLSSKIKARVRNNPSLARAMLLYIKQKQKETGKTIFTSGNSIWEYLPKLNENAKKTKEEGKSENSSGISGNLYEGTDGTTVVEDKNWGRYKIQFPGKPDSSIISTLKRNGFRWSPSTKSWVCYNTSNGERALSNVAEAIGLKKVQKSFKQTISEILKSLK